MATSLRASTVPALIGVVVGGVTAAVGFVLADVYRPQGTGATLFDLTDAGRQSREWSQRHRVGSAALVVVALLNLGLIALLLVRSRSYVGSKGRLVSAVAAAVVASVATVITRPLVEWDQVALWSVTVGSDFDGYWSAAFGDDVRFVLMGSTEVSQRAYGAALLLHLAAPLVSAVAFALTAAAGRAPGSRRPTSQP